MSLTLFIALFCLLTITGTNGRPPSRIVGGESARINEFPYSVILKDHLGHFCGGAIIGPRHVLTAGHCLFNQRPKSFVVVSGLSSRNDPNAIISEVQEFHIHPHYVDYSINNWLENDVAVITLKEKLDLDGVRLKAAKLPISRYTDKTVAVSLGYGPIAVGQPEFATHLQKVEVQIDNELCESYSHRAWGEFLCGWNPNAGHCGGDSGGPLMLGDTVIGVTSAAVCQIGGVTVYSNVFHFKPFIRGILFNDHALY